MPGGGYFMDPLLLYFNVPKGGFYINCGAIVFCFEGGIALTVGGAAYIEPIGYLQVTIVGF